MNKHLVRLDRTLPLILVALLVSGISSLYAAKGGKGGGGNGSSGVPPAAVTFRDAESDTIQSDGLGPYVDGFDNIQATTESELGQFSLYLFTPDESTNRQILFDFSQLEPLPGSSPTELILDGVGQVEVVGTTPQELPAAGETVPSDGGTIAAMIPDATAPAGVTWVQIYFFSGAITAIDANTYVWSVSPTDLVAIWENKKKYKGKRLVTADYIDHGNYLNGSFSVTFTRLP